MYQATVSENLQGFLLNFQDTKQTLSWELTIMEDSASSLAADTLGVARPSRMTVCLARFLA